MSALILGATSPIARALAAEYAEAGHTVFVAARDAGEAERIAADVAIRHDAATAWGAFDALDLDRHDEFIDSVEEQAGPIEVAVLAFGAMGDQEHSQQDVEAARRVIDVNYTGAVSLCEALARRMSERGRGSIVGLSSVAGDRGRKSNYIYGSAKGAFTLYLGGLRNRLAEDGVHVLTVKLGFIDTRMTYGMESPLPKASPEDAAAAIFSAQQSGREVIYYPRFWAPIMGIIRAIPAKIFKRLSI
jgi:NAD(P)-dependent dehydrogenase (short-subunit alcohol dehydrogenase family)